MVFSGTVWQSKGHIVFFKATINVWELEEHVARLVALVTPRMKFSGKGLDSDLEHVELGPR